MATHFEKKTPSFCVDIILRFLLFFCPMHQLICCPVAVPRPLCNSPTELNNNQSGVEQKHWPLLLVAENLQLLEQFTINKGHFGRNIKKKIH